MSLCVLPVLKGITYKIQNVHNVHKNAKIVLLNNFVQNVQMDFTLSISMANLQANV